MEPKKFFSDIQRVYVEWQELLAWTYHFLQPHSIVSESSSIFGGVMRVPADKFLQWSLNKILKLKLKRKPIRSPRCINSAFSHWAETTQRNNLNKLFVSNVFLSHCLSHFICLIHKDLFPVSSEHWWTQLIHLTLVSNQYSALADAWGWGIWIGAKMEKVLLITKTVQYDLPSVCVVKPEYRAAKWTVSFLPMSWVEAREGKSRMAAHCWQLSLRNAFPGKACLHWVWLWTKTVVQQLVLWHSKKWLFIMAQNATNTYYSSRVLLRINSVETDR